MPKPIKPATLNPKLTRYYSQFRMADTQKAQEELECKLKILSDLSPLYFPVSEKYYCRSFVEIGGGREIIFAASIHHKGKIYHAEEVLAKILFELYANDPDIISFSDDEATIHIDGMYLDIRPCKDNRYAGHQCDDFFNNRGGQIEIGGIGGKKSVRVHFESKGSIYWNADLPPDGLGTNVRSIEKEREMGILGIDHHSSYQLLNWKKSYVVNGKTFQPEIIDLNKIYAQQIERNKITPEGTALQQQLVAKAEKHSPDLSANAIASIITLSKDNPIVFNQFVKAILQNWSLRKLLTNPDFTLNYTRAIRELQELLAVDQPQAIVGARAPIPMPAPIQPVPLLPLPANKLFQAAKPKPPTPHVSQHKPTLSNKAKRLHESLKSPYYDEFYQLVEEEKPLDHYVNFLMLRVKEYAPLATLINMGYPIVLQAYLKEFKNLMVTGRIQLDQYIEVLFGPPVSDNYLLKAIRSQNAEKFFIYVSEALNIIEMVDPEKKRTLFKRIFLTRDNINSTALHVACNYYHPQILNLYLKILDEGVKQKYISKEEYSEAFISPNQHRYTAFSQSLQTKSPDNLAIYFSTLNKAIHQGYIDPIVLGPLLAGVVYNGASALHHLAKYNYEDHLELYLHVLKEAISNQYITEQEYVAILLHQDGAGYTPLNQLLQHANSPMVIIYLRALENAFTTHYLSSKEYNQVLCASNRGQFTPLLQAFKRGNIDSIQIILDTLRKALLNGILTKAQYGQQLVAVNADGYTILHQCFQGDANPETASIFFENLQLAIANDCLDEKQIRALLLAQTRDGINILADILSNGTMAHLELYIELLKSAMKKSIVSKDEYLSLLTSKVKGNYTPFHLMLLADRSEHLAWYLEELKNNLTADQMVPLFFPQTNLAYSLLHCLLQVKKPKCGPIFFAFFEELVEKDNMHPDEFVTHLTATNNFGCNPLYRAISNDEEIFDLYFAALQNVYHRGWLTPDTYCQILLQRSLKNISILEIGMKQGKVKMVEAYLNAVQQELDNGMIKTADYIALLTNVSQYQQNPLYYALGGKDVEIVKLYLKTIESAVSSKHLSVEAYKTLYLPQSGQTSTTAMQALSNKNAAIALTYLTVLERAVGLDYIKKKELGALLARSSEDGNTPLHKVIKHGDLAILEKFFFIINDGTAHYESREQYEKLLTQSNCMKISPLHEAITSKNPEVIKLYLKQLHKAYMKKSISSSAYMNVLIGASDKGITPLHMMFHIDNQDLLEIYLHTLQVSVKEGILSATEYTSLLLKPAKAGFSPLHDALKGSLENLVLYLAALKEALAANYLTYDRLLCYMCQENHSCFTPLHQAAKSGNLSVIKEYIRFIQYQFPEDGSRVILEMLVKETKGGFKPTCPKTLPAAREINHYLRSLERDLTGDHQRQDYQLKLPQLQEEEGEPIHSPVELMEVDRALTPTAMEEDKPVPPTPKALDFTEKSEFILSYNDQKIYAKMHYILPDQSNRYMTYSGTYQDNRKIYIIQLKPGAVPGNEFNFSKFRADVQNAILIINIPLPLGAHIALPPHTCFLLNPPAKVQGRFTLIGSEAAIEFKPAEKLPQVLLRVPSWTAKRPPEQMEEDEVKEVKKARNDDSSDDEVPLKFRNR